MVRRSRGRSRTARISLKRSTQFEFGCRPARLALKGLVESNGRTTAAAQRGIVVLPCGSPKLAAAAVVRSKRMHASIPHPLRLRACI